jgi:hypothetical protein
MKLKIQTYEVTIEKLEVQYAYTGLLETANIKQYLIDSYQRFVKKNAVFDSHTKLEIPWCTAKDLNGDYINQLPVNKCRPNESGGPYFVTLDLVCSKPTSTGEKFDSSMMRVALFLDRFSLRHIKLILKEKINWDKDAHSLEPF